MRILNGGEDEARRVNHARHRMMNQNVIGQRTGVQRTGSAWSGLVGAAGSLGWSYDELGHVTSEQASPAAGGSTVTVKEQNVWGRDLHCVKGQVICRNILRPRDRV
jgi:hypothetical protein